MTGVSWGGYQEYLNGSLDGLSHWDEAQTDQYGQRIIRWTRSTGHPSSKPTCIRAHSTGSTGVDGYIAQVWTGTAQTPNVYNGVRKARTFETAFLEYGIMQELVRGTDRRM